MAITNLIYSTGFEAAEGYNANLTLAGQNGWLSSYPTDMTYPMAGNGFLYGYLPGLGQQALVGGFLDAGIAQISVWRPINLSPIPSNTPIIACSTLMQIDDMNGGGDDDFQWSVYNTNGARLVTLDFNKQDGTVNFILDNAQTNYSGVQFSIATMYSLLLKLDFQSNRWSAWLGDAALGTNVLATDQPITTSGAALNFGHINAGWAIRDPANPGGNIMAFDNYTITAESRPAPQPQLSVLQRVGSGNQVQLLLRLAGEANSNYALDVVTNLGSGWFPLRTNNTGSATYFDFFDTTPAGAPHRFYRARQVP